jgi:hypothetical protein
VSGDGRGRGIYVQYAGMLRVERFIWLSVAMKTVSGRGLALALAWPLAAGMAGGGPWPVG